MTTIINKILAAKQQAGHYAWLWLHDSDDGLLWKSQNNSINDDGSNAIDRWRLSDWEMELLSESDEIMELFHGKDSPAKTGRG